MNRIYLKNIHFKNNLIFNIILQFFLISLETVVFSLFFVGCSGGSNGGAIVDDKTALASLTPCELNSISTNTCITSKSGIIVTESFGGNINQYSNVNSKPMIESLIPSGYYFPDTYTVNFSEPNLISNNIVSGKSIFNVTGTTLVLSSNIYRENSTSQLIHSEEAQVYAKNTFPNSSTQIYREIPDITKDDDGYLSSSNSTALNIRAARPDRNCGINQASIEQRIQDCEKENGANSIWNGAVKANAGQGIWKLVTRKGINKEVWQDQRTKLLWSSVVAMGQNWCQAAGNGQTTGNGYGSNDPTGYCNNAAYQPNYVNNTTSFNVKSWCAETSGASMEPADPTEIWGSTPSYSDAKGGMGLTATATSPSVRWRLPTKFDYEQADINGIRFVFPEFMIYDSGNPFNNREWTATIDANARGIAFFFSTLAGISANYNSRNNGLVVRCVGR